MLCSLSCESTRDPRRFLEAIPTAHPLSQALLVLSPPSRGNPLLLVSMATIQVQATPASCLHRTAASFLISCPPCPTSTLPETHASARPASPLQDTCTHPSPSQPCSGLNQARLCPSSTSPRLWGGEVEDHAMWPQPAEGPAPRVQEEPASPEAHRPPDVTLHAKVPTAHPSSSHREMWIQSGCARSGTLVTHPSENKKKPQMWWSRAQQRGLDNRQCPRVTRV